MSAPVTKIMETDRLFLKELTPALHDYWFSTFTDEELCNNMGFMSADRIDYERQQYAHRHSGAFCTFKRFLLITKSNNETIGECSYFRWYEQHHRAEVGYGLALDEYKNKGYLKEAMPIVLAHGFEEMKLNRIEAFLSEANTPSLKLVTRFGFKKEGVLRQHYNNKGVFEDSSCFSLLQQEYLNQGSV